MKMLLLIRTQGKYASFKAELVKITADPISIKVTTFKGLTLLEESENLFLIIEKTLKM